MKRLLLLTLLTLSPACLRAAERVALVIGNNAYQNGNVLANPVNDAEAVGEALKAAGFSVTTTTDASLEKMERAVLNFKKEATGAKAAWFFYAGHGLELNGENYLVPVDAKVTEEFQVKHKTLALDQVLGAMHGAGVALKVVTLDCCRDNPMGRGFTRSSGGAGLAALAGAPKGTIIAYATAPKSTAEDGDGKNSPFTTALVANLKVPGLDVDQIFKATGKAVLTATRETQQPWVNSSYFDNFVFLPGGVVRPPVQAVEPEKLPTGPFTNSLGMKFVSVADTPGVQWSIWETRVQDYAAYCKAEGVTALEPDFAQTGTHPVVCVSWRDAVAFAKWLSQKEGKTYRLPTDHEWSLAVGIGKKEDAKASPQSKSSNWGNGDAGVFPWGTAWPPPAKAGNYWTALGVDSYERTSPAGSFSANSFGLYDLGGNVNEWCQDWYDPSRQKHRVLRGGSWLDDSSVYCSSACRYYDPPTNRGDNYGFRVVLVVGGGS
jgi:hypothetical protein